MNNNVFIIKSKKLSCFKNIINGISTRLGGISEYPYQMNLSFKVGDNPKCVKENRRIFFNKLGINESDICFQNQIHSNNFNYADRPKFFYNSDALYTDKKNVFLAVTIADCYPVMLYEPEKKIIAAIHSGWKGTYLRITEKLIAHLKKIYKLKPENIIAFIGPGISVDFFEVSKDVFALFPNYVKEIKFSKYFVDLKKYIINQLLESGVILENIEISDLCTFKEKNLLHSYRRDKENSGRMVAVIGMV